jgi:hypothetical protein
MTPEIINVLIIFLITSDQCLDFKFQMNFLATRRNPISIQIFIYKRLGARLVQVRILVSNAMMDLSI